MTGSTRALCWLYLIAALFLGHCAVTSARADAWWYAAALFGTSLLAGIALAREYVVADERRRAAVQAERAARLRVRQTLDVYGWDDLSRTCCLRSWESRGTEHDSNHCTRKDQAA